MNSKFDKFMRNLIKSFMIFFFLNLIEKLSEFSLIKSSKFISLLQMKLGISFNKYKNTVQYKKVKEYHLK